MAKVDGLQHAYTSATNGNLNTQRATGITPMEGQKSGDDGAYLAALSTNVSVFNRGIQIKNSLIPIGSFNVDKDLAYIFKISLFDKRRATNCRFLNINMHDCVFLLTKYLHNSKKSSNFADKFEVQLQIRPNNSQQYVF